MKKNLLVIVGPTASGKTSLSIELAKHYNGEIISADSMQIYRGMSIATAKPTYEEMAEIKHYLIDFLDTGESYSVGKYVEDAKEAIDIIRSKEKLPIICGGTGLYVDSLLNGINFIENSSNLKIREELNKLAGEKGIDYLLDYLSTFDEASAKRLSEQKNPKRIIRAIEFYKTTGVTITEQNEKSKLNETEFDSLIFGLTAKNRQYIYDRINKRVDIMLESGLLEEAEGVLNSNLSETSSKAIGYKQLIPYFNGERSLEECIERLKTETRHYAKRQLTWFRRNENINWINIDELKTTEEQLEFIKDVVKNRGFLNG
ncbi:MAG: tRNA (adenosine(37)-N6)-dimethylallyltransferase MiaA [Ruminococcus sp.]|nr:tRNA (adenosine(37)-N6)-dimethylallyltransferase MiaA [Ruminococcus sp.]